MEKQTIEMIIMGRAVPEQRRNGRIGHCTAGFSPTFDSLIRLYPVPFGYGNRWEHIEVEVEKNPKDTRKESWKIASSKTQWSTAHKKITRIGKLDKTKYVPLIKRLAEDTCIRDLNDQKASLSVIKPQISKAYIDEKDDPKYQWITHHKYRQITLNGKFLPKTGKESPHHVRVIYRCPACKSKNPHKHQVLEWGTYRWFEKNPDNKEQVIENLRLFDDEFEKYFLIGNLAHQRTTWVVISVFRWKKN